MHPIRLLKPTSEKIYRSRFFQRKYHAYITLTTTVNIQLSPCKLEMFGPSGSVFEVTRSKVTPAKKWIHLNSYFKTHRCTSHPIFMWKYKWKRIAASAWLRSLKAKLDKVNHSYRSEVRFIYGTITNFNQPEFVSGGAKRLTKEGRNDACVRYKDSPAYRETQDHCYHHRKKHWTLYQGWNCVLIVHPFSKGWKTLEVHQQRRQLTMTQTVNHAHPKVTNTVRKITLWSNISCHSGVNPDVQIGTRKQGWTLRPHV